MKKIISYIGFLMVMAIRVSLAQETPTGEIEDAQIIIEKDKPLTLPKAGRVYEKTEVLPVQSESKTLEYRLSQPGYQFEPFNYSLNVREYATAQTEKGTRNYVKAGLGNYVSPLLQGYYGYQESDREVGVYVFHESFAHGPVRGKASAYGATDVILNGNLKKDQLSIAPRIAFSREAYHYYGYNQDTVTDAGIDQNAMYFKDKVGLNNWDLSARMEAHPDNGLDLEITPRFGFTTMGLPGEEAFNTDLQFDVTGDVAYAFSDQVCGDLGVVYDYLHYKSNGLVQNRNLFQVSPNVRISQAGFKARIGIKVAVNSDSVGKSNVYAYPDLSGAYELTDQLSLFADITGGMNAYSLNDARLANRYLQDSLTLLNQNTRVDVTAGIQYHMSTSLVLKPYIGYRLNHNKALMVPSATDTSRFEILYDRGNFGQTELGVQIKYLNNKSSLLADMALIAYQPDQVDEAWYLPTSRINVVYTQLIGEVLTLKGNLTVLGGIKGKNADSEEVVTLNPIVDLGMGANYAISPNFSAFGELKNIVGIKYERYLNYPVRGVTGKLGFIYRF